MQFPNAQAGVAPYFDTYYNQYQPLQQSNNVYDPYNAYIPYDQYSRTQQNNYAAMQYWSQPSYPVNPPPPSPPPPVETVPVPPESTPTVVEPMDIAYSSDDSETSDSDDDDMSAIELYLTSQKYRDGTTKSAKNVIRRKAKHFVVDNGTLYYQHSSKQLGTTTRRQVIDSKARRRRIIHQCHVVNGVDGHFGGEKTFSAVQAPFYWKGIVRDVREYVKVCDPCQRENPQLNKVPATLHPIPITVAFWHQLSNY